MQTFLPQSQLLILVANFNEPMMEKSSMTHIATKHAMVDILFQCNSCLPEPNTYAWGSTHIDYVLISLKLAGKVKACGYEPFHKQVKSDHPGMFLDFDTQLLFGNDMHQLGVMAHWDFTVKNLENNTTYTAAKFAHLTQQQFFHHLNELQDKPHGNHLQAKKLEQMLWDASNVASKKVK
jgi:hypothetical protein